MALTASAWRTLRADVLIRTSANHSRRGDFALALAETERAAKAAPGIPIVWVHYAGRLSAVYRYQDALNACERALALDSTDPWALHSKVQLLLRLKELPTAHETARRALDATPSFAPLWMAYSSTLFLTGQREQADAEFDRAWQICAPDVLQWNAMAVLCRLAKRPERALLCYDRALALTHDRARISRRANESLIAGRLGALEELGDYERALREADMAIRRVPMSPHLRVARARILDQMKQCQAALDALGSLRGRERMRFKYGIAAIRYHKKFFTAWLARSVILHHLKRYRAAFDAVQQPLGHYPDLIPALANMSGVLGDSGRYAEAIAWADRAIALEPRTEGVWTNRGGALFHLGRYSEALAALERAIPLEDAGVSVTWMYIGRTRLRLGQLDQAEGGLDTALKADGRNADAWVGRAELQLARGLPEQALATLDHALTLDPELALAWRTRGAALRALGNEHEATAAEVRANALDAAQRA